MRNFWRYSILRLFPKFVFSLTIIRETLTRAGPGRSWPVLAGPGRSWPVLAGPRLLVFRKKSAPHPQLVSLTEMRTKGRKPLSVLRLKIFEKVFSENYETLFFRGPARTGQDRPGPARTGQDRPYSVPPKEPLFMFLELAISYLSCLISCLTSLE